MKFAFKLIIIMLSVLSVFTSCRQEEIISINPPLEETLDPDSNVADLMLRTVTNDGSKDNILDYANCFKIKLPTTVIANAVNITINTEADYDSVESIFDEFDEDIDNLSLSFPITIILTDFSEAIINNISEFNDYAGDCNGENVADNDIEFVDFIYPITSSIFNTANELISRESFSNDKELFVFIANISESDIISMDFPLSVRLYDGSQISINTLSALETTIQNAQGNCDEDDDFDYNDDDCNHCTQDLLSGYLTNCTDWIVDKLKRESVNYDDYYDGYSFNFFIDGTVSSYVSGSTVYGTWESTGTANDISVIIDIPGLPLCNNIWHLQEIDENDEDTKIDLRLSDANRLRYENTCN